MGKRKVPAPPGASVDPLDYLQQILDGKVKPDPAKERAARTLAQYRHAVAGHGGKKAEQQRAAGEVAERFASAPAPLRVVKGGR